MEFQDPNQSQPSNNQNNFGPTPPVAHIPTENMTSISVAGKKNFPFKKVVIGILVIIILVFLGLFAFQFLSKNTGSVQKKNAELTFWGLWEDNSVMQPLIDEYEKKTGVKINYIKQSTQDYRERLINSLAKGTGPDIFLIHNTWVPMFSSQLSQLPPSIMDAASYQSTFFPVAVSDLTQGTRIVGMPLGFDGLALFVNNNIFSQASLSPPSTWDDLRRDALKLTVKDDQGHIVQAGVALGRTDNVDHWQDILSLMLYQNGADPANPVGQLAQDSLLFYTIFSRVDGVWDGTLPPSTQAFASGNLAMYFGPSWSVFEIKQLAPNLSFTVVPVPQLPSSTPGQQNISWASYWAASVWAKSPNANEAWKFLSFLSSKESLLEIYQEASKVRLFGMPYPRQDMESSLENVPYVGAYIRQAPFARSWYLAGGTFDGPTGINSRISKYYEDAVNSFLQGTSDSSAALTNLSLGISQVLSDYSRGQ